eukprot:TRINITY_DN9881_c0_g1_i2.p1 TRINITY_DN9881_c0_g1~~TRINITY_DN9881_c0_g1_i2.p1  ORF type:complete len:732 (-),score=170.19 TRINITY_DN9881_c0_g1_i2:45-2219(-)
MGRPTDPDYAPSVLQANHASVVDLLDGFEQLSAKPLRLPELDKPTRDLLTAEHDIWLLMQGMVLLAQEPTVMTDEAAPESQEEIVGALFRLHPQLAVMQTIVDSLEAAALVSHGAVEVYEMTWVDTRRQFAEDVRNGLLEPEAPLLDPDAQLRTGKRFHADDLRDEEQLLRTVFQMIRCGKLDDAQRLCLLSNQPWRASALSGGTLGTERSVQNEQRAIWKKACLTLCAQPGVDQFEKAAFGVLCGNVDYVIPVCQSQNDFLWAELKATISQYIDLGLAGYDFEIDPDTLKNLFLRVEARIMPLDEDQQLVWRIKMGLCLGNWEELVNALHQHTYFLGNKTFLRAAAHLVLLIRKFFQETRKDILPNMAQKMDEVMTVFFSSCLRAEFLLHPNRAWWIVYVSHVCVPKNQAVEGAKFLMLAKNLEQRKKLLFAAQEHNLDIHAILAQLILSHADKLRRAQAASHTEVTKILDLAPKSYFGPDQLDPNSESADVLEWLTQTTAPLTHSVRLGLMFCRAAVLNRSAHWLERLLLLIQALAAVSPDESVDAEIVWFRNFHNALVHYREWYRTASSQPRPGAAPQLVSQWRELLRADALRAANSLTAVCMSPLRTLRLADGSMSEVALGASTLDSERAVTLKSVLTTCVPLGLVEAQGLLLHTWRLLGEDHLARRVVQLANVASDNTTEIISLFSPKMAQLVLENVRMALVGARVIDQQNALSAETEI